MRLLPYLLQLISHDKEAFFNALKQEPAAVLLFLYTAIMLMGLGSLVVYHVQLIVRNYTTYEQFKSRFSIRRKLSPYSHGFVGNCVEVSKRGRRDLVPSWPRLQWVCNVAANAALAGFGLGLKRV